MPSTPVVDLNTIHDPAAGNHPPFNWGDQIRDNCVGLATFVGVTLRRAAVQAIPNAVAAFTAIAWDTEDEDSDGFHPAGSGIITIPAGHAGVYHLDGGAGWAGNATGNRSASWYFNNVQDTRSDFQAGQLGGNWFSLTKTKRFAAGDTLELRVQQTVAPAAALNIINGDLTIVKLTRA